MPLLARSRFATMLIARLRLAACPEGMYSVQPVRSQHSPQPWWSGHMPSV